MDERWIGDTYSPQTVTNTHTVEFKSIFILKAINRLPLEPQAKLEI